MIRKNIAIQLTHMREQELLENKLALEAVGVDPFWFGTIPFTDELTGLENLDAYDVVVPFGATKVVKLYTSGKLNPTLRVFYDTLLFDQRHYGPLLGGRSLNAECTFTLFGRIKDVPLERASFIKPARDLKAFAGMIVEAGDTPGSAIFGHMIQDSAFGENPDSEPVLIAALRDDIVREYRNFIVGGKRIASSTYKIGTKITYEPVSIREEEILDRFFEEVASVYSPGDTYVVDFALLASGELKVIEFNCINCCGMYSIDRRKLFEAILAHA